MDEHIECSFKQCLLVIAMTIDFAALDFCTLYNIPIDAFPDVTNVKVQVIAEVPGLSPVEADGLVVRRGFFLTSELVKGTFGEGNLRTRSAP